MNLGDAVAVDVTTIATAESTPGTRLACPLSPDCLQIAYKTKARLVAGPLNP